MEAMERFEDFIQQNGLSREPTEQSEQMTILIQQKREIEKNKTRPDDDTDNNADTRSEEETLGDMDYHDSDMAEWKVKNEFTAGAEQWKSGRMKHICKNMRYLKHLLIQSICSKTANQN